MQLFIASGESKNSEVWAHDVSVALEESFSEVHVLPYAHWEQGASEIDLNAETERLHELANTTTMPYAVLAKSIGTLVTLQAIHNELIDPEYCVFVGLPFKWTKDKTSVAEWLKNYDVPTLFIQQTDDPSSSYDDLDAVLEERDVQNRRMVEVPGNDHKYADIDNLKRLVACYVATPHH